MAAWLFFLYFNESGIYSNLLPCGVLDCLRVLTVEEEFWGHAERILG